MHTFVHEGLIFLSRGEGSDKEGVGIINLNVHFYIWTWTFPYFIPKAKSFLVGNYETLK